MNTRTVIICGIFGATTFAGAFLGGLALTAATGIPIMSAVANGLIVCFLLTIANLSTRTFGTTTLMMFVYGILAIPTALLGPPGIHKIIIALSMGLFWDLIVLVSRYRSWSMPIGAVAFMLTGVYGVFGIMYFLGLPGLERLQAVIALLALASSISGIFGSTIAVYLYNKRLQFIPIFQNNENN